MTYVLRIGAPLYRLQLHAAHCAHLVELAGLCAGLGRWADGVWQLVGPDYTHTSILPAGRARILHDAMMTPEEGIPEADFLYMLDGDTWCDATAILELVQELAHNPVRNWAMCGVVVEQDDGRPNAWAADGVRLNPDALKGRTIAPVYAIGAAATIYNLAWYREQSARVGLSWPWISYGVVPTGLPGAFVGEDHYHCRAVAELGGAVLAVNLPGTEHASFAQPALKVMKRGRRRRGVRQ